jgi:UDP-GlcNAc:undecaprenyl-phosphate GlcNAc-1-phosphate transferase
MLIIVFAVALSVALAATPLVALLSRRSGRVAAPSPNRWHAEPTALFGGVAITAGFVAAVVIGFSHEVSSVWLTSPSLRAAPAVGVVTAALMMFAAGFADDLVALRPPTKLVLQTAAAAVMVSFGVTFQVTPWTIVNGVVTFVWFVGVTNALNLLDNMDGVAAGVSAIAAAGFAALFAIAGMYVPAGLALALAGACAGFLVFNTRPARIFMGDCGSLFIGSLLAGLGAVYSLGSGNGLIIGAAIPILILCVPIFDTALVTYARLTARHPLSIGGRDHTSHRLAALGLPQTAVAVSLYAMTAGGALISIAIARTDTDVGIWSAAVFGIGTVALAAYLSRVHAYSPSTTRPQSKWSFILEDLLYRRRLLEVLFDLVLFAAAYWGAFLLRWDGALPPDQQQALARTIALAVAAKSLSFVPLGVYRGLWQQVSVADVHRLIRAVALGAVSTAAIVALLVPDSTIARSIFVLDALLVLLFAFGVRLTFRSLDRLRRRLLPRGNPTLIYGAGAGGDIALREILSNAGMGLLPVGFLDDDPRKNGVTIQGLPVYSAHEPLEPLLRQLRVQRVIIGTRQLGLPQLQRVRVACHALGVQLGELRVELVEVGRAPAIDAPAREDRRTNIGLV